METIIISPNGDPVTLVLSARTTLAALGLENVDNTSDANKPVSIAQATAIEAVSIVKSIEYTLTSSQILNLHTTPVQYLAPLGANKYAVPISAEYIYTFGATAYTRNSSASMIHTYNAVTNAGIVGVGNILTISFNAISRAIVAGSVPVDINQNLMLNQGLYISLSAGSFTLGDGTLKIKVLYHVVTV